MRISRDFTCAYCGENLSRKITFTTGEENALKKAKLGFITPRGNIYFTKELEITGGKGEYLLPSALTDGKGTLLCQLFCWDDSGYISKSAVEEIPVSPSLDDEEGCLIPEETKKSLALLFEYLEAKADREHSHGDMYCSAEEVKSLLAEKSDASHNHDDVYPTRSQVTVAIASTTSELSSALVGLIEEKSDIGHTHDESYYDKDTVDGKISSARQEGFELVQNHDHNGMYYTEAEIDSKLEGKSDYGHNHDESYYSKTAVDDKISSARQEGFELVQNHDHNGMYYTEAEVDTKLEAKSDYGHNHDESYYSKSAVDDMVSSARQEAVTLVGNHDHNGMYYTEAEVDTKLEAKSDYGHNHDESYYDKDTVDNMVSSARQEAVTLVGNHDHNSMYYTEAEINSKLQGKSDYGHNHDDSYYSKSAVDDKINTAMQESSELVANHNHNDMYYTEAEINSKLEGKSDTSHTHDGRYYTETETVNLLTPLYENTVKYLYTLIWNTSDNTLEVENSSASDIYNNFINLGKNVKIRIKEAGGSTYFDAEIMPTSDNLYVIQLLDYRSSLIVRGWKYNSNGSFSHYFANADFMFNSLAEAIENNVMGIQSLEASVDTLQSQVKSNEENIMTVAGWFNNIKDFVVEQGKSESWTYRKWNSGVAECWGEISASVTGGIATGGECRIPVTYPFSFTASPIAFIHPMIKAYLIKKAYNITPETADSKSTLTIYAQLESDQFLPIGDNSLSFYVHVRGLWK